MNPPPTEITRLEDGTQVIRVGHLTGTVSSGHLVPTKERQLQQAWLAAQGNSQPTPNPLPIGSSEGGSDA